MDPLKYGYETNSSSGDILTRQNSPDDPPEKDIKIQHKDLQEMMNRNLIFDTVSNKELWYTYFNRYGWINIFENDQICREYIFFTKPDLYIFDVYKGSKNYANASLCESLKNSPVFVEAAANHRAALSELQSSCYGPGGHCFLMKLLTNCVTSKMDLPGISSEFTRSTQTVHGSGIDYRTHSMKSDFSYDFTLSFRDTAYLDIYYLAKCYDEYIRLAKLGEIDFHENYKQNYIINHIIPEQFSVYKFLVGSDGETILYYAKATGVSIVDVPRSEFGDPGNEGFKYSLSFHANFVEDSTPDIINEFNLISPGSMSLATHMNVMTIDGVNNAPAKYPVIVKATGADGANKRTTRRRGKDGYDYLLKWTNTYQNKLSTLQSYDPYTKEIEFNNTRPTPVVPPSSEN